LCDRGLNFEMNQKLFCHEELTDEQVFTACLLTARQYGEVVLPDAASGQGPGTLARKRSRCKEGMAHFLPSGYKFCELYEYRGTMLIGAANLSPVTKLVVGTGAVSRYNLSRSQKFVKVQDFYCGQMWVSGCNGHYKLVLGAGVKAKSVTNNLPILSVLAKVVCPELLQGTRDEEFFE
jgi:hypothetical protein